MDIAHLRPRRGNPNWVKGASGNPPGRPRGQTSVHAVLNDPGLFFLKHRRWYLLCMNLGLALNWTKPHAWLATHRGLRDSELLKAGTHPKAVQEQLGHANIQTTLNIYSHVGLGIQEAAALRFDDMVLSGSKDRESQPVR